MVNEQQTQMLTALAQGLSMPPRTPILRTPEEYGLAYEEISFTTADGVLTMGASVKGVSVDMLRHVLNFYIREETIKDETLARISLLPYKHVIPNGTYFIE